MVLPEPFVVTAQRECIRTVGIYNGESHKFLSPVMDPTRNSIEIIRQAFTEYNLFQSDSDFDDILKQIRLSGDNSPEVVCGSAGEDVLTLFDIVKLYEEDGSVTTLLYLGNKEFFMLESSKSSILFKDILVCNTMPVREDDSEEFQVIRDGKPFSPQEFGDYKFPYCTKTITRCEILRTSSIQRVIDECDRFGGCELQPPTENPKDAVLLLIQDIKDVLEKTGNANLPKNQEFPEYQWLLGVAKSSGIRSFVLNAVIEIVEQRKEPHYAFVESDWKKSEEWLREEERKRYEKELSDYNRVLADFKKAIGALKQRRVLLFFKAETKVTAETEQYIKGLISKLEDKAMSGFGQSGYAASEYSLAKERTKPLKGENLKTGATLFSVVVLSLFVAISWVRTNGSKELFDKEIDAVSYQVKQDKDYVRAMNACDSLYHAFRPSYTRFAVSSSYRAVRSEIEQTRESEKAELIEAIASMREASGGRFNKYAETALFRLLEIAPDDIEALNLKQEWMNH